MRLQSLSLSLSAIWIIASGKGLPHILVSLVLLVDEMVSGRDVVVTISF